jgi:hypothetical protein
MPGPICTFWANLPPFPPLQAPRLAQRYRDEVGINLFIGGELSAADFAHYAHVRQPPGWPKDELGQCQPFVGVLPQECLGQLASSGPT